MPPAALTSRVCEPVTAATSASSPTTTMFPSRTAKASAHGRAGVEGINGGITDDEISGPTVLGRHVSDFLGSAVGRSLAGRKAVSVSSAI